VPYTPEQNGVAERMNQTLTTRATTNLAASHLPRRYWTRAMLHAAYTIMRSPASAQKGRTPHEGLYDRPVDLQHMHPFGCPAYPLVNKQHRKGKFSDKATRCVFIGYHEGSKAYDLLDVATGRIITSRHVVFDDNAHVPSEIRAEPVQSTAELERLAQSIRPTSSPYYDDDVPQVIVEDMPSSVGESESSSPASPVAAVPPAVVQPSGPPLRRVGSM
jgi:hypothetical protein